MKLWLDDVRPPWKHGAIGYEWAKTYNEAIDLLKTGRITFASLDHDLSEQATLGFAPVHEKTGYDVICWMEEHDVWPPQGVAVHSLNPSGRQRMEMVIQKQYGRKFVRPVE